MPDYCNIIYKIFYSIINLLIILQNAAKCGGDIKSRRLTLPILAMIGNILLANNISPLLCRIIAKLFNKYFYSISILSVILQNAAKCGGDIKSRYLTLPILAMIGNYYWLIIYPLFFAGLLQNYLINILFHH